MGALVVVGHREFAPCAQGCQFGTQQVDHVGGHVRQLVVEDFHSASGTAHRNHNRHINYTTLRLQLLLDNFLTLTSLRKLESSGEQSKTKQSKKKSKTKQSK